MTLVIVHKTPTGIYSISDTKLSYDDGTEINPYYGALKSHLIGRSCTLHYAGYVCVAEEVFDAIQSKFQEVDISNYDKTISLISCIRNKHKSNGHDSEFILTEASTLRITKISDKVVDYCERVYIGDSNGYKRFMDYYQRRLEIAPLDEFTVNHQGNIEQAFKKVIADPEVCSIGGFPVGINQRGEFFEYQLTSQYVPYGAPVFVLGKASVEAGSYWHISVAPKASVWPHCYCIYFNYGSLALVWSSDCWMKPRRYANCTYAEMFTIVSQEYGVAVRRLPALDQEDD